MKTDVQNEVLNGSIFAGILKMALPLMLLNLINTGYALVDTFFVGKISELAVGAVSLVAPIIGCGNACIVGLCSAAVALISLALGEGSKEKADKAANHIFFLGLIFGVAAGALFLLCRDVILVWMETPAEIYQLTRSYLTGISFDFLFLFIVSFFQSVKQAAGNTRIGVVLNIAACLLNCVLDPLFIYVFQLGTFGAAIATLLSKALMAPIALRILLNPKEPVSLSKAMFRPERKLVKKVITVALPATVGQFLASFGFVLMSKEIVSYGAIIMSAYGIGNQISSLFYIPLNGIGSALTTFIGQNLGSGNRPRARECYRKTMGLTAITSVVFTVVGFFLARPAINLFIRNASELLIKEALIYAYFSIFTSFCMGWFNNLMAVYNGSGNTLISMILSACRLFAVRIPVIWLLARFTNLQHIGIWVAMIISNLIICLSGQIIYRHYPWDCRGVRI